MARQANSTATASAWTRKETSSSPSPAADQVTNLWDFAGLFLKLGCRDALFLDGDISQAVTKPDKDIRSNRFAAIFVITE